MEDEKAASRAAWSRHQRFVRQKRRGRGGRVGTRRRDDGVVIKEQQREYGEGPGEENVGAGDDYEEWLESCPKEMPMLLRRQRHVLPDVSFMLSQETGGCVSGRVVGDIELGALGAILDRLPDSIRLDISEDMCRVLGIEYVSVKKSIKGDFFAKQSEDVVSGHPEQETPVDTKIVVQETVKNTLEDDLDALLDLGEAPGRGPATMIGEDEQEDLDAWFDGL